MFAEVGEPIETPPPRLLDRFYQNLPDQATKYFDFERFVDAW